MASSSLSRLVLRFVLKWLLLPALLFLLIGAVIWFFFRIENIEKEQRYYTESLSRYVSSYLEYAGQSLDYVLNRAEENEPLKEEMELLLQSTSLFEQLFILNSAGRAIEAVPQMNEIVDFSGIVSRPPEGSELFLTTPYYSVTSKRIVVGMVRNAPKKGMVLAELNLEVLQNYVENLLPHVDHGFGFITDGYGNIIAHPDMSMVQRQENVGNRKIFSLLENEKTVSGIYRINGRFNITSGTLVSSGNWVVVISRDAQALLVPAFVTITTSVIGLVFFLSFLAFLFDRRLYGRIIRPLADFTKALDSVKKDDAYKNSIALPALQNNSFRELETLYNSFKEMQKAIAEREYKLRESEKRWQFTLEEAGDGVWDWDIGSGNMFFSRRYMELLGYDEHEFAGNLKEWKKLIHPEDAEIVETEISKHLNGDSEILAFEHRVRCRDGLYKWILSRGKIIERDAEQNPLRIIVSHTDITERKKSEESLKRALKEKEILLKEIHHRVKNNLNVVASLLSLQADEVKSVEDAQTAFLESYNRVYSMALVHENLYRTESFSEVDMKSYINTILDELIQGSSRRDKIELYQKVEDIHLDITYAVPCGIILNELLTNILKHAFPNGKGGYISVLLKQLEKGGYELRVHDNGIGISEKIDYETPATLGLKLVHLLTEQIHGKLQIEGKEGTTFIIQFGIEE